MLSIGYSTKFLFRLGRIRKTLTPALTRLTTIRFVLRVSCVKDGMTLVTLFPRLRCVGILFPLEPQADAGFDPADVRLFKRVDVVGVDLSKSVPQDMDVNQAILKFLEPLIDGGAKIGR